MTAKKNTANQGVDFGTYHHSTPEKSRVLREDLEATFSEILKPLYPAKAALQILDAGCGLGFLASVAMKCFPAAHVTGIDLFQHSSMSAMSIEKAEENMRLLGLASRTSFRKHDLTQPVGSETQYDLVVSNAVFHNLNKKRFAAYDNVFQVLKPVGFFVLGDLFPHDDKTDMEELGRHATLQKQIEAGRFGRWTYRIKVLRAKA